MTTITGSRNKIRGRLSAADLKLFAPDPANEKLNLSASDAHIPIVYGRKSVPGLLAGYGTNANGDLICRVIWCMGEVYEVEAIYVNDVEMNTNTGPRAHTYRGTKHQALDWWWGENTDVTTNEDDLVLLKPGGLEGVCYSVIKIPSGDISNPPKFQAIIKGALVFDPDDTGNGDPYADEDGFSIEWIGTNGSAPTDLDTSTNNATLIYNGGATIQSNKLDCNPGYCAIADDASNDWGTGPWCLEVAFETDTIASGTDFIVTKGNDTSEAFGLYRSGSLLGVQFSTNGTSWEQNATMSGTTLTVGVRTVVVVEYTGREYFVWVDGVQRMRWSNAGTLASNTINWQFGAKNGGNLLAGKIHSVRFTKGHTRYHGHHVVGATPFADSDSWTPGHVYSDNPALCFGDLATNPVYGMGATVDGLDEAEDWCNDLLGGVEERAQLSLRIDRPRKTADWLDLLATYANCFWYHNGSSVVISPDRPADINFPNGQEQVLNAIKTGDSDFTKGTGWVWLGAYNVYQHSGAAAGILSQTLGPLEDGVDYVFVINVLMLNAGTWRVRFNGTEIIPDQTDTANFEVRVRFTADATMTAPLLEIEADANLTLWVGRTSLKRLYWLNNKTIRDTLQIQALRSDDTPTRVNVKYTVPVANSPAWLEGVATAEIPGVDSGEVPLIETSVSMKGVYRVSEAANKASARLLRLQNQVRVSWETTDSGIAITRGTVVQYINTAKGVDLLVLVESVELVDFGRYAVTGLLYSDNHYPGDLELGEEQGTVPVGAIVFQEGETVPSGWQAYSGVSGKYIKLASEGGEAPTTTGGDNTFAGFSDSTEIGGGHSMNDGDAFEVESFRIPSNGSGLGYYYDPDETDVDAHSHTFSTGSFTPDWSARGQKMIQKITSAGLTFPPEAIIMAAKDLAGAALSRITNWNNRLMRGANSNYNSGTSNKTINFSVASAGSAHNHWTRSYVSSGDPTSLSFTAPYWDPDLNEGGAHTHTADVTVDRQLKRARFGFWNLTAEAEVTPGMCVLWEGSLSALPDDWTLCNGKLGTVDVSDRFLQVAAIGAEGQLPGSQNTVGISGQTSQGGGHDHKDETSYTTTYTYYTRTVGHGSTHYHRHNFDVEAAWEPAYYVLAMIMYNPSPEWAFNDVGFLISGGGTNGSDTITDSSDASVGIAAGAGGNKPTWSNAQQLFGKNTLLFDASTESILTGTVEWGVKSTTEGFFRIDDTSVDQHLFGINGDGTDKWRVELDSVTGEIVLVVNSTQVINGAASGAGFSPADAEWFYVAVTFDGTKYTLWAGTDASGTAARQGTYTPVSNDNSGWFRIGGASSNEYAGHMSEIRIVTGAAIYDAAVIGVPAQAFPTS